MAEYDIDLKQLAQRMMTEKWEQKRETMKYIRQSIGYLTQERLMKKLDELNLKELEMISGCGIPGDAWRYSIDLIKKKKLEVELFITQGGAKASATIEHELNEEESRNGASGI